MGNVHMEATQINYREGGTKKSVAQAIKDATELTPEQKADINKIPTIEAAVATKASQSIIAPEFDSEAGVYAIGDLVMHKGKLYEFTTAHETAGEWDSTEVTEKTVADEIGSVKSGLIDVNSNFASLLTSYSTTSLTGVKYVKLGKLVCVTFDDVELSSTTALGIPTSNNNIVLTLRDQTVGGIVSVTMASNAAIASAAGNANFVAGHKYAGIFVYLSND